MGRPPSGCTQNVEGRRLDGRLDEKRPLSRFTLRASRPHMVFALPLSPLPHPFITTHALYSYGLFDGPNLNSSRLRPTPRFSQLRPASAEYLQTAADPLDMAVTTPLLSTTPTPRTCPITRRTRQLEVLAFNNKRSLTQICS